MKYKIATLKIAHSDTGLLFETIYPQITLQLCLRGTMNCVPKTTFNGFLFFKLSQDPCGSDTRTDAAMTRDLVTKSELLSLASNQQTTQSQQNHRCRLGHQNRSRCIQTNLVNRCSGCSDKVGNTDAIKRKTAKQIHC